MVQRILICGGRDYDNLGQITKAICQLEASTKGNLVIIAGGARGADRLAALAAKKRGIHTAVVDALWDYHGKSAGPRRNKAMIEGLKPHLVVAFPGGKGTEHSIATARLHGIEVWQPLLNPVDKRTKG